jgi:hypothetical protein
LSGFEADLVAIGDTASALATAAESVAAAVDRLEGCSGLGPGRLDAVTGTLIADTRAELSEVRRAVAGDAELVAAVRGGYATLDEDAATALRRAGGDLR